MKKLLCLLLLFSISSCSVMAINDFDYTVKNVHDGDTLRVIKDNQEYKIRLACIDARELKQKGGIGDRDFLRKLIRDNGDRVKLNVTGKDRYKRLIAEVYVKQGFIQELQVKNGKAFSYPQYKKDCPNFPKIENAEQFAKNNKLGLWSEKNVILPSEFRKKK